MSDTQDYYMELASGAAPLPVVVNGTTYEERVALARVKVSQPYEVMVNMALSDQASSAFERVRFSSEEGQICFSLTNFIKTMNILVNEGRRLAWVCLQQGAHTRDMKASYERVPILNRTENLVLEQEPIVIPGGETFFIMTKENALSFMAETIRDEAIYALQDAARGVN